MKPEVRISQCSLIRSVYVRVVRSNFTEETNMKVFTNIIMKLKGEDRSASPGSFGCFDTKLSGKICKDFF